jgi:hypothetical protein
MLNILHGICCELFKVGSKDDQVTMPEGAEENLSFINTVKPALVTTSIKQ